MYWVVDNKAIHITNIVTTVLLTFPEIKDIAEQTDLSAQMPEKVQELSQLLTQYLKERKAQRPTYLSSGKLLPYPDGSEN